jgi:hypothetical protein
MSKYIARSCPQCRNHYWVVISQKPRSDGEYPINSYCALCGYRLDGWRLVMGRKRQCYATLDRSFKVVR